MNSIQSRSKSAAQARFDTRLSQYQKDLFEEAARIKGFKSLSEFVIYTTQEAAVIIVERYNSILASEKDKKLFFNALVNSPKPGKALLQAAKRYKKELAVK